MYYQKIVGSHIYLSPANPEHETAILAKWFNEDREIAYGNSFYHRLLGNEKVNDLLEKWNEGPFLFSVVHKESHAFMGHITLFDQADHEQYATMGIYLGEPYRHFGYGKEAISLLADYAFQTLRLKAIHLELFSFNHQACRAYESIGFQECGRWHSCYYHMGEFHDIIMMELLKDHWQKK